MFVFGHLGIGLKLAQPFSRRLDRRFVALGAILPDLIDKPLFYLIRAWSGTAGQQVSNGLNGGDGLIGFISGTRTLGHAAFFTLVAALLAFGLRKKQLAAVALGMATHHLLDSLFSATPEALFWPLLGFSFPIYPFANAQSHLASYLAGPLFWAELLGAVLLIDELWFKARRRRRVF